MEKEDLLKLIKLYHQKECLWNMHSPTYKWTEVKREANAEIAKEMGMTEDEVKKKIRSLRGTYVQEKKKLEKRKKCGKIKNAHNIPSLWWYNEMSFIDKCIIRRTTLLNVPEKIAKNENQPDMYDKFCTNINHQLRRLSEKDALVIMRQIQKLIANATKIEKSQYEEEPLSTTDDEKEIDDSNIINTSSHINKEDDENFESYAENFVDTKSRNNELLESIEIEALDKTNSISTSDNKTVVFPSKVSEKFEEEYIVKLQSKSTRFTTRERKFKCPICDFAGTDRSNMLTHIQRHSVNKPHKCDKCGKCFHTRTELITHTRSHTGERPYLCTLCGSAFTTSSKLCIHIKRHNNTKDKECPVCKKRFYNSQSLRDHANIHNDKREYCCTECNASFKQKSCLQNHVKLHENKRGYPCKLCNSKFNQHAGLYSHMKTCHTVVSTSLSVLI